MDATPARCLLLTATIALTGFGSFTASPAAADTWAPISGAGWSAGLEIAQWQADVRSANGIDLTYDGNSPTDPRNRFAAGEFDFVASDLALSDGQQSAAQANGRGAPNYVPISAAPIAFMFHLLGTDGNPITELRLSAQAACTMFTTPATYWDDPGIVADNPNAALPHTIVRAVVRSDETGVSEQVSRFCIASAPNLWATFITAARTDSADHVTPEFLAGLPTGRWPVLGAMSAASGSDGLANAVASPQGLGSVGYVDPSFAMVRQVPVASIENADQFVAPTTAAATATLKNGTDRGNGRLALNNSPLVAGAYPVVNVTYAIVPTAHLDVDRGRTLAAFLTYAVTDGQRIAPRLGFAPLPAETAAISLAHIGRITDGPPPAVVPEAPRPALLVVVGLAVVGVSSVRRRRSGQRLAAGRAAGGGGG